MPDDSTPTPTPDPPSNEEAEKSFWDKFDKRINDILDKKLQGQTPPTTNPPPPKAEPATGKETPPAPGTSRMRDKRVTLPGLIADVVFGPSKE